MDHVEDAPGCAHHVHIPGGRLGSEPTLVCSCPAGLIHMHDCPVMLGLECCHLRPAADPTEVAPADYERLHAALMDVFLSRSYVHRIRGLAPAGDDWQRRRDLLGAEYADQAPGDADEPLAPDEIQHYEEERDRLISLRKKREERERERQERSREERARERARMGIKTVVEKAVDAVAATGNVASSVVDDMKLEGEPGTKKKKRRRRRRKGKGGGGPAAGGQPRRESPKGDGGGRPKGAPKRRRRRRRRRKPGEGSSS